MIKKIYIHLLDIIKNPFLLFFLVKKYFYYVFLKNETPTLSLNNYIEKIDMNKTFIRWGDGETNAALGISFSFERSSKILRNNFHKIIKNTNKNILIGLPVPYISFPEKQTKHIHIWKTTRIFLAYIIDTYQTYGDAFFFRNFKSLDDFLEIYKGQNLFLISNKDSVQKAQKKIPLQGVHVIPKRNAFKTYDIQKNKIKEKIQNIPENTIILVSGGPFAKVLCYDLTIENKRICHDIGAFLDIYL